MANFKIVQRTMNCVVRKVEGNSELEIIPETSKGGDKEISKIDQKNLHNAVAEVRDFNLRKYALKLAIKKPKVGDKLDCEVQYIVKDDEAE